KVELTAAADASTKSGGLASADADITVAGTIKGRSVALNATANANAEYADDDDGDDDGILSEWFDDDLPGGDWLQGTLLPAYDDDADDDELPFIIAYAAANSGITLADAAKIFADGDVTLDAQATRSAEPNAVSAVMGAVLGETSVDIDKNATVEAGDTLSLQALSTNSLAVEAESATDDDDQATAALAFGIADDDTGVHIARGASVKADNLVQYAGTRNDFSTVAGSEASTEDEYSAAGLALAFAATRTTTTATLGADLDAGGNVSIAASDVTTADKTAATTSAASSKSDDNDDGQNADKGPDEDRTAAVGDAVLGKIKGKLNNAGDQTAGGTGSGSTVPLDGAAALSVALTEHTAEAAILEDTAVEADGDITVLSNVQHKGVRNYAISGAKAKGVKD